MSALGQRLRAERKRLGLSQEAFAALGGVKKVAQINYERGSRKPNADYLKGIADAGADILYILAGSAPDAPEMDAPVPESSATTQPSHSDVLRVLHELLRTVQRIDDRLRYRDQGRASP